MSLGKVAIISGSTRGIGRAIANSLQQNGYQVAITGKTKLDEANYFPLDLRDKQSIQSCVDKVVAEYGKVDLLINNASALYLSPMKHPSKTDYFDLVHNINSRGTYYLSQAVLPHMPDGSRIITHSPPIDGDTMKYYHLNQFFGGKIAYITSKLSMSMITRGLSEELRERRIACNCIWPKTAIETDAIKMLAKINPEIDNPALWRKPEIITDMVNHLLDEPDSFTGNYLVDQDYLESKGVSDFSKYQCKSGYEAPPLFTLLS